VQQEEQNQTGAEQGADEQSDKNPGSITGLLDMITRLESAANPYNARVKKFINDLVADVAVTGVSGEITQEQFDKEVDSIFSAVANSVGNLIGRCSEDPTSVVGFFVTEMCTAVSKGEMLKRISSLESDDENKCETCAERETCMIAESAKGDAEPVGVCPAACPTDAPAVAADQAA